MKTIEYVEISDALKKLYDYSEEKPYAKLFEMKKSGELDKYFEESGISENFEKTLKDFISIIENDRINCLPYYSIFCVYSFNCLIRVFSRYHTDFGLYFIDKNQITSTPSRKENFGYFPCFFRNACIKYNIEPYASMKMEEIESIIKKFILMGGDTLINVGVLQHRETSKYANAAEEDTYNSITDRRCFWVSRDYGDGFGYDLLAHDDTTEDLIEVKSSTVDGSFELSRYEHKIMYETYDSSVTNYYVYVYTYKKVDNSPVLKKVVNIYKYNKEKNLLVDINDENCVCEIQGFIDFERDKNRGRIRFKCIPKKLTLSNN